MQYKRIGNFQFFYTFVLNNIILVNINWNTPKTETTIPAVLFLLTFISYIEYRIEFRKIKIVIIKTNIFIKWSNPFFLFNVFI